MSRLLVKVGGAQLAEAGPRAELAQAVAQAHDAGHELVLVHGGGDQMRRLSGRLGIEDRYHEGLRITDSATAELALMVLGGQVNRLLVDALRRADLSAVGLTGADGSCFFAQPLQAEGVEMGFVGEIAEVHDTLVEQLIDQLHIPVLATVAPLHPSADASAEQFYNINADHAAGPLAAQQGCDTCLFLTDVPGVLDGAGQCLPNLDPSQAEQLRADEVITGGMIPKVQAGFMALAAHPEGLIKIAPARGPEAICAALEPTVGTRFAS